MSRSSAMEPNHELAVVTVERSLSPDLVHLATQAERLAENARAPSTRRAYAQGWREYTRWCKRHGLSPVPSSPQQIVLFLTWLATEPRETTGRVVAWRTLRRTLAAIAYRLRLARGSAPETEVLPTRHPIVLEVLRGIRNEMGVAVQGASPLTVEQLRAIVRALPDTLVGRRDRCIVLLGFSGAFRRSELAAIQVRHITWSDEGVRIFLPTSKTDRKREGRIVAVPYGQHGDTCPVLALRAWLDAADITGGPMLRAVRGEWISPTRIDREGRMVARVLQRAARAASIPVTLSGHSMRAGFVTAAAEAGVPEWKIQETTGHKRKDSLDPYIRRANLFRDHALRSIGI